MTCYCGQFSRNRGSLVVSLSKMGPQTQRFPSLLRFWIPSGFLSYFNNLPPSLKKSTASLETSLDHAHTSFSFQEEHLKAQTQTFI